MLLHDSPDFADLVAVTARELAIDPGLVEKDYWIMQALWGLQQAGFRFALKGGTSLSKGHRLIERFSEDIDILIEADGSLPIGRNQDKPQHIAARAAFYDCLAGRIEIPGFTHAERDHAFDDGRLRSAGIRLVYNGVHRLPDGVKTGILLEAGFDQVAPNLPRTISSWAYDKAIASGLNEIVDNRAVDVPCYEAGYTLVEKLQTISTKYRHEQANGVMPQNFMRHYYDVYCLLGDADVQAFIGTPAYIEHKRKRFPKADEMKIAVNPAFQLSVAETRRRYEAAYGATRALYYRDQPPLAAILARIAEHIEKL